MAYGHRSTYHQPMLTNSWYREDPKPARHRVRSVSSVWNLTRDPVTPLLSGPSHSTAISLFCEYQLDPRQTPWRFLTTLMKSLQWRHNERNGASNHQRLDYLLNRFFSRRSKKTSKLRVTGLCEGIHRWQVNSPHKGSITRKLFPFDDVIMWCLLYSPTLQKISEALQIISKDPPVNKRSSNFVEHFS